MAATTRGQALEYLEGLPGSDRGRLYEQPSTALAIFGRMLPHLAKTFVMAMLYTRQEMPAAHLEVWVRPESRREYEVAIDVLLRLNILRRNKNAAGDTFLLTRKFASSLKLALTGGGNHQSFGVPTNTADRDGVDAEFLDEYARAQWENILYYIVGSAGSANQVEIADASEVLLVQGGLVELRGRRAVITQKGFTFLLQEVNAQLWSLLVIYLKNADKLQMNHIEMLSFLFTLGSLEVVQDYSTHNLTPTQKRMLVDLNHLGVVYLHEDRIDRFYPTRLATSLNSDSTALIAFNSESAAASSGEKGFIVVETNYRVYAYTNSPLRIQILSLFTKLSTRYPNMVTGRLTKESIQSAIALGITAQQIVSYLTVHAHPVMNSNPRGTNPSNGQQTQNQPTLPPTVVDQIRLWQIEGDRMKATPGYLFKEFRARGEYEDCCAFAEAVGVLQWKNDNKRMFFVTRHEQVAAHIRATDAQRAANGS